MRILGRILKWLGLILLALIAAGALYQQIGAIIDDATVPATGTMIAVDGHRVHLVCMGAGKRTLVLDAGLGGGVYEWYRVQPALAVHARVCAFDRPGLGASEAIAHVYDGITAADELHALTRAAGIARPFVYVGHSLGANFAQIYAARYPRDVTALVLIEPGVPADLLEDFHGSRAEALAMPATCGGLCIAGWTAGALGLSRLVINHLHTGAASIDPASPALLEYRAGAARSAAAGVSAAYLAALPRIAYQLPPPDRARPTLVLASAIDPPPDEGETPADMAKWRRRQLAWFVTLSAQPPVVIPGATHTSMVMGPPSARTIAAITAFLATLP